jgi:hypothetical protein
MLSASYSGFDPKRTSIFGGLGYVPAAPSMKNARQKFYAESLTGWLGSLRELSEFQQG